MALITYLAEDNETILENLIETLQEIAAVEISGCGATEEEASRWLATHDGSWHLAILDLFLREGSGLGVLAGCRNREFYQKVVVLTNYATPEIRKRSAELGADAVFDKSSELDGLFAYCIEQTSNLDNEEVQRAERAAARRGRRLASN
ncbi:MAG: response regulator [Pseudomonadota bacterium]